MACENQGNFRRDNGSVRTSIWEPGPCDFCSGLFVLEYFIILSPIFLKFQVPKQP